MEWKLFKDELPDPGRWIVYGNHRQIETAVFHKEEPRIKYQKLSYKDVTHWDYCDPPPRVDEEMVWK